ncbi:hypothetical protein [Piscinibacter terrae]|uniref:Uncharacterized protein n=1 Tax=Piscinibacter terrae TaxID=2496871 RepID=A0A3N7J0H7_9BURK|nr:hypothetical protein [Albitalea terrae]RQP24452.1 hypothetical protein DZC73_14285 [Albitalea terrae]
MHLIPFISVDEVPFTVSRETIMSTQGRPLQQGRNDVGLNELDYGSVVYRFQDNGRLEEVTMQVPVLHLDKISVPFATLAAFVGAHDTGSFERAGFIVSPRFGLAFDPECPSWVTALAPHCLDTWRAL